MTSSPINTISDEAWRSLRVRQVRACPNLVRFGSAEQVRDTKLKGQQYRAAKKGWN